MKSENLSNIDSLRQKAEAEFKKKRSDQTQFLKEEDNIKLLYELQVHQIELEMQNDELRRALNNVAIISKKFTELYEFSPLGYYTLAPDCKILELNLAGAGMLNKNRDELVNSNFNLFISQDTLQGFNEFLQKVFITKNKQICEVKLSIKDSPFLFVHIEGIVLTDKETCIITLVDITREKQAKAIQKENQIYLETIINTVLNGIILSDRDGNFEIFNKKMEEICGYTKEEANQDDFFIRKLFTSNEQQLQVTSILKKLLKEGGTNFEETELKSKSGDIKYVLVSTSVLIRNNKPYILSAYNDITKSKHAENEKNKFQEQLNRYQKLESLGVLAGGISHNFNNLLMGIFGNIELARLKINDPNISRYLSDALSMRDRAKALTGQLLTFSRGGSPLKRRGYLHPLIKNIIQFSLSETDIKCSFDIEENLLPCNFDTNQISQVLTNIILNVIQAMPDGGAIEVIVCNIFLNKNEVTPLPEGMYLKISIKDSGSGISSDIISRIFDPFFTTSTQNTGLGLTVAYSIILNHDGMINAESVSENGSTINIYLPALAETIEPHKNKVEEVHTGTGTIIIMDDESIIRMSLSEILISMGYDVVQMEDGREVLSFFNGEYKAGRKIEAVILDLIIPGGMGGKATALEIRKIVPEIPIFAISGYSDDPVMMNPADSGFTTSLNKPFFISELAEILNIHLSEP